MRRWALLLVLLVPSCRPDGDDVGFIEIINPTSAADFTTSQPVVVIGGNVGGAGFINWTNSGTGASGQAFGPFYNDGLGTWFDDTILLAMGANIIVFSTETGASDTITITRIP